jgi:hypothetical protein
MGLMQEKKNTVMDLCTPLPPGQQTARTRWNSHESGAAFDRKKTTYLTEEAQQFIAHQPFYMIAGLGPHGELDGRLEMSKSCRAAIGLLPSPAKTLSLKHY